MVNENIDSSLYVLFHTNIAIERIIVDHPFDVQYIAFSFDNFYNPDFLADLLHNNLPTISSPLRSITTNVHGTFYHKDFLRSIWCIALHKNIFVP